MSGGARPPVTGVGSLNLATFQGEIGFGASTGICVLTDSGGLASMYRGTFGVWGESHVGSSCAPELSKNAELGGGVVVMIAVAGKGSDASRQWAELSLERLKGKQGEFSAWEHLHPWRRQNNNNSEQAA